MIPAGHLSEIAEAIEAPRGIIETAFLELGDELSLCSTDLGDLVRMFEALAADFQGEDIQAASATLDAVAAEAGAMADAFAAEGPVVAGLVRKVTTVSKPVTALTVSIRMIGMVALNARIVAAGLAGEVSVFRTDITALAAEAGAIVKDFSGLFDRLALDLRQVAEQRRQFASRHERTLHVLAAQLRERLAQLAARRDEAAMASRQTAEISRGITGRVAAAVVALQVGDSARQRIEHVQAALRDCDGPLSCNPAERDAFCAAIVGLQAALLQDTAEVFDAELAGARAAVRALKSDAAAVFRQSRSLQRFEAGKTGDGAEDLGQELRQIAALLGQCDSQRRDQTVCARQVVEVVRALTAQAAEVSRIEGRLRSLCLNATLACSRLGPQGKPLAVIADQIHALTGETARSLRIVLADLDDISESALVLSKDEVPPEMAAGQAQPAGSGVSSGLGAAALTAVARLDSLGDRLLQASAAMERLAPRTAGQFESASTRLERLGTVSGDLRREAARLHGYAGPSLRTEDSEALAVLDLLRARYTMQRERDIHDAMFGARGAPPAGDPSVGGSADPEEDLEAMFL